MEKLQADQLRTDQKLSSQQEQLSSQQNQASRQQGQLRIQQEQLTVATAERQALQRSLEEANSTVVTARQVWVFSLNNFGLLGQM